MNIRETIACAPRKDIKNYLYFIGSTGLFQTYRGWVSTGRRNPHLKVLKRKEPTSRAEIAHLFELGNCA
jgi:hypothetical protein